MLVETWANAKIKKTSHTEVHITEISQSRHDRMARHVCSMTQKIHVLKI